MQDDPTSEALCLASLGPRQAETSEEIKAAMKG